MRRKEVITVHREREVITVHREEVAIPEVRNITLDLDTAICAAIADGLVGDRGSVSISGPNADVMLDALTALNQIQWAQHEPSCGCFECTRRK